ncbi:amidase [Sabulicella glaciei]|uniref:Amidase n=1 Tax=Sabulicella glaciei TaxID=2984948 RepID=A0ABT3NWN7_9PROT|nr:amidase [Roseococcus sp. MDT2-1-1]MCW8086571.1 amidase [Roseococcus sp. MDT2-1-1]
MDNETLAYLPISSLASRMARGELCPVAVTEALLARIGERDGVLNSYITIMAEPALAASRAAADALRSDRPRGPLHGVPIALKDLLATRGVRTTSACAAFADWAPDHDAIVVERLAAAGAVIIGKNNMHEAAAGSSGLVSHSGPMRNPWDTRFVTGGSSGGSAAAVAAGLAFGAVGSDTAMSIRHPAAYCGVVGLKPSFGRVSKHGALPLAWSLDHVGPITRTVRDAALMLGVLAGFDPRDPASLDRPVPDYAAALDGDIRGLRVGVPRRHFFEGCEVSTLAAVEAAIGTLRDLGATLEECELPHAADAPLLVRTILLAEAATYHAERLRQTPELLSPSLKGALGTGSLVSAVHYVQAQRARRVVGEGFARVMAKFDVLVMPTTPLPACRAEADEAALTGPRMRNTAPFNLTGLPALSLPCGFTGEGMPVGLQIVGRAWDEATVLRVADVFERATEWHKRRPGGPALAMGEPPLSGGQA